MKIANAPSAKCTAAAAFFVASSEVMATGVGLVTHTPVSTSIPMLGGAGLIVMSALLAIVSLRFLKERHRGGGHFLVLATVVGALAAGGSGLKLINDANAGASMVEFTNPGGATVTILLDGCNTAINKTGVPQQITGIVPEASYEEAPGGCVTNGGYTTTNGGIRGVNAGGTHQGTCNDDPPTVLGIFDTCDFLICSLNAGSNGGCAAILD